MKPTSISGQVRDRGSTPTTATLAVISVLIAAITTAWMIGFSSAPVGTLLEIFLMAAMLGVPVLQGLATWEPFRPVFVASAFLYFFLPVTAWGLILSGYRPVYLIDAYNWNDSFRGLLLAYLIGLPATVWFMLRSRRLPVVRVRWGAGIEDRRIRNVAAALLGLAVLSFFLYVIVVAQSGGLASYVAMVSDVEKREALGGMGLQLVLAEGWPSLAFLSWMLIQKAKGNPVGPAVAWSVFGLFIVLQLGVAGLRGSRANTVWPILIMLAVYHSLLRPVSRMVAVVVAFVGAIFAFTYGLYKALGRDVLKALGSRELTESAVGETGRNLEYFLFEDLGRLAVQVSVYDYRRTVPGEEFAPPSGLPSYFGDVAFLFPDAVFPSDRVWGKTDMATALFFGRETVQSDQVSSRIFGFVGEAVLNWGLWAAPVSLVVFGIIVQKLDRVYVAGESRPLAFVFVVGPMGVFALVAFIQDFDNLLWFSVKNLWPFVAAAVLLHMGGVGQPGSRPGVGHTTAVEVNGQVEAPGSRHRK